MTPRYPVDLSRYYNTEPYLHVGFALAGGYIGYQYPKVEQKLYEVCVGGRPGGYTSSTPAGRPPRIYLTTCCAPLIHLSPPRPHTYTQDVAQMRKEKNLSSPDRVGGNLFGKQL